MALTNEELQELYKYVIDWHGLNGTQQKTRTSREYFVVNTMNNEADRTTQALAVAPYKQNGEVDFQNVAIVVRGTQAITEFNKNYDKNVGSTVRAVRGSWEGLTEQAKEVEEFFRETENKIREYSGGSGSISAGTGFSQSAPPVIIEMAKLQFWQDVQSDLDGVKRPDKKVITFMDWGSISAFHNGAFSIDAFKVNDISLLPTINKITHVYTESTKDVTAWDVYGGQIPYGRITIIEGGAHRINDHTEADTLVYFKDNDLVLEKYIKEGRFATGMNDKQIRQVAEKKAKDYRESGTISKFLATFNIGEGVTPRHFDLSDPEDYVRLYRRNFDPTIAEGTEDKIGLFVKGLSWGENMLGTDKSDVLSGQDGDDNIKGGKGRNIILATGSKVSRINIPGIDSKLVLTSDDILDLREIPKTLAVMGGGVVGVELGLVYASYGTEVTVIEMADRIIPGMDREVSVELQKVLSKKGMKFLTSVGVQEIVEANNQLTIKLNDGSEVVAEKALLSIGRVPQLAGLENLNLELDRGRIKVNAYQETSIPGIYAPGDVNGTKMLAHAAYRMGEVAAENAMTGNHHKAKLDFTPAAVYTHPEIAMVGLTEEQAREQYGDILIGRNSFTGNGRAIASNEAHGFVKVIADAKYHEVLGVHIIGPVAAEMINEAATIMEAELTVDDVAASIHGHPTFSEVMYEAFLDVLGVAIHNPPKRK